MTETHELLRIGLFAEHAKTKLRTLRYYEEVGLLSPVARSQGRFRYYRREDLNRTPSFGEPAGARADAR